MKSSYEEFKFKCYLLSRYRDDYRADQSFDSACQALIETALSDFAEEDGISLLQEMLSQGDLYSSYDKENAPILIYTGDPICYGVLDHFALSLGQALSDLSYLVEFFNPYGENVKDLSKYAGKRYKAVVGVQSFAFSVKLMDGKNLHDHFYGPKFNMLFDHPVWLKKHLENGPKDYFVLTHDKNYIDFTNKYFKKIKGSYLLPPAGDEYISKKNIEKDLPLTFIGSYHDYRLWEKDFNEANEKTGGIARRFFDHMLKNPDETFEEGLEKTLLEEEKEVSNEEFLSLLFDIKPACFMVMSYFREKVLDKIAEEEIPLHVFSNTFKTGRYKDVKTFIKHDELSPEESILIYRRSKVSLNIMSWHKAGMTERIANMMLNRAVCVTDNSSYLLDNYFPGQDYISFDLKDISALPSILKKILDDPDRQNSISSSAYEKASIKETWERRAKELIRIIEETEEGL